MLPPVWNWDTDSIHGFDDIPTGHFRPGLVERAVDERDPRIYSDGGIVDLRTDHERKQNQENMRRLGIENADGDDLLVPYAEAW